MRSNSTDETQPMAPQGEEPSPDTTLPTPVDSADPAQPAPPSPEEPEATQPVQVSEPPPLNPPSPVNAGRRRPLGWIGWSLLGFLLLTLIAAGSSYRGYLSAIQERTSYQKTQIAGEAQAQFDLGLQDLQAGRYDLARQRFEYVININPGYPGVTERLAEVLLALNSTATPTTVPTPTVTPTPDLRGREELYTQAQAQLLAKDWSSAIDTLLTLRKRDPTYQAVEVDGLLFVALRNRGVDKIARQADLEGGTYDLALAERFGPLDVEANNWRSWAELYVRGASFWGVDWPQAVFYFSQLAPMAPNLVDRSGYTATERYRLALIGYGGWLASQQKWCDARDQYKLAFDIKGDQAVQPTVDVVVTNCENPTPSGEVSGPPATSATLTPTPEGTLPAGSTPTPTTLAPVVTPTVTSATPYP